MIMTLLEILQTIFIISMVTLGVRTITDKEMIFYFLRKPFENLKGWKKYIMKPVILCCVCMPSLWGTGVFYHLHGINSSMIITLIICVIGSSFINRLVWIAYERIAQLIDLNIGKQEGITKKEVIEILLEGLNPSVQVVESDRHPDVDVEKKQEFMDMDQDEIDD